MATEQKDFRVKKGLIVGGNIASTTSGFLYDSTSNVLSLGGTEVALQPKVDLVQDNVSIQTANLYNTYTTLTANTYNTYLTLTANDLSTYNTLSALIDTVQDNVVSAGGDVSSVDANLYNTYVTLSGNIDTVQDNVATNVTNIDAVQANLTTLEGTVTTAQGNIDTVQDNVATNATRLDSLKYFRSVTANGVNVTADANADSLTLTAGDGITLIGNDGTNSIEIHVDGSTDIDTVQDNVAANATKIDLVQDNVAAITDGSTPFSGNVTFQQDVTIDGDLIVGGTTTTIGSTDTTIEDRTLILSNGAASAGFDTGILMSRGTDSNVFMGWDESADQIAMGYTQEEGSNVVTDYTFSGYVDLHVGNLIVEGTVDGVDVAAANLALQTIETALPTISDNTVTNATRLDSLVYYNTIQVSGQSDVAASSNADILTFVAGTGVGITTSADQITISSTVGGDINTVQDNVATNATNIDTVSSNVDTVDGRVDNIIDGTTPFTGDVTFNETISADVAKLNTQLHVTSNVKTGIGATDTEVFNFPGAVYRGAELVVLTQDITNTEYQINKMLIIHDGTDVHFTEYGLVHTGAGELAEFNVTIDGSDVISVRASGGSANKKISVASHNLIQ